MRFRFTASKIRALLIASSFFAAPAAFAQFDEDSTPEIVESTPPAADDIAPAAARSLSTSYVARPITLRQGVVRFDAGAPDFALLDSPRFGHFGGSRGLNIQGTFGDVYAGLGLGGAYGISDQLEVGTLILPLLFSPDFDFGDIDVYARYAIMQSADLDVALQGLINIPTATSFGFGVGLPVLYRFHSDMRFETGVELELNTYSDADLSLEVPFSWIYNIDPQLFFGIQSGIYIPNFNPDFFFIRLQALVGYTIPIESNMVLDIYGRFGWPTFLVPGGVGGESTFEEDDSVVATELWELSFGAKLYFDTAG